MKTIEMLGLEKEYNEWKKNIKNRKGLSVGDRIELVKRIDVVPTLKIGMKGYIKSISEDRDDIKINFDELGLYNLRFKPERYRRL